MTGTCYYHPDQTAVDSCVQCGVAICDQCRDRVGEKSFCKRCVAAVRQRVEQQMAAGAPVSASMAQSSAPIGAAYSASRPAPADGKSLALGIVLALVIGIVGAIAIEKILVFAHFGLSLLYVFLGYGIGICLHRMSGRGGADLALLACGIMLVSLVVGELVFTQDVVNMVAARGRTVSFAEALPVAMSSHGVMHWVCLAIGLYACYRGMEQQGG